MISLGKQRRRGPTFVLAILGDYGRVESALARSIERLEEIARRNDCRIVAALEDGRWQTVPLVQTLAMRFAQDRFQVFCGDCPDRPATLFSAAAARAEGEFLQFLWPGCLPQWNAVAAACRDLENGELDWLGFIGPQAGLPELCSPDADERFYCHYLSCGRPLALCQAVVRRTGFLALDGFRKTPLLQRAFDADYWLRSLRRGQKGAMRAGALAESRWTWEDFPLHKDLRVPRYLAHSYRVRTADCPNDAEESDLLGKFAADLPPDLRRTVERLAGAMPATFRSCQRPPCKIAVTGGPWEYAHNRVHFYNPFADLEGQGLFTYVPLLDHLLIPERDLRGIDAVVISRGRHAEVRKVLDYCRRRSIPTLYMIDDNWFWAGKDWPDPYASIFAPGLPQYEMFLACLRECDAVMVYSDVLADDVRQYAKQVIRLPANVRPADFAAPLTHSLLKQEIAALLAWRQETGGLVAGYAGSRRYSDGAFQALAAASQRTAPAVKVVLFGGVSPGQLQCFDNNRAVVLPYVGYETYAAAMGALEPDILVAPLDRSRTSMSKCPTKYFDYSIAGAAGIYSDLPPYAQTIADGTTGLLVRGDDAASWAAAIARLIEDEALRRSIVRAARRDIRERHETAVVAPAFAAALRGLIDGHRRAGNPPFEEPATC